MEDYIDNMMDRIDAGKGSILDHIQKALGMYAHGYEGPAIASDNVKAIMRYHGTQVLAPTNDPYVSTYKRDGKVVKVAMPKPGQDYDDASFQRDHPGKVINTENHGPDKYKLPSHITFSSDSQYSSKQFPGGKRQIERKGATPEEDIWGYTPSPYVLTQHPPAELQKYFREREPKSVLHLPK